MTNVKTGVLITGNAKGAVKAVALTKEELKSLNKTSRRSAREMRGMSKASQGFIRSTRGMTTALAGFIAGASAFSLQRIVSEGLASVDTLGKVSTKLGIASQDLATLRLAASETAGMTGGQLDMALQRMTRRLAEAAKGTGEAKGALKELGVDAVALAKQSPDKAFREIADAMQDVEDPSQQLRIAFKLFDSEGAALVNTLKEGSAGLDDFQAKARTLGLLVVTDEVERANDALNVFSLGFEGFKRQFAVASAPYLEEIGHQMLGLIEDMGGMEQVARDAFETMAGAAEFLNDHSMALGVTLTALATTALTRRLVPALAATGAQLKANALHAVALTQRLATVANVSRSAAAGQVFLAQSARGATAAMAAFGGPVGLATTAAATLGTALYAISDAQSGVIESSDDFGSELDRLTEKFEKGTRANKEYVISILNIKKEAKASLVADLKEQVAGIEADIRVEQQNAVFTNNPTDNAYREQRIARLRESLKEPLSNLDDATTQYEETLNRLKHLSGRLSDTVVEETTEGAKALTATLEELSDKYVTANSNAEAYNQTLGKLNQLEGAGLITKEDHAEALTNLAEEYKSTSTEAAEFLANQESLNKRKEESIKLDERLLDIIDPLAAKRKEQKALIAELDKRLAKKVITQKEYEAGILAISKAFPKLSASIEESVDVTDKMSEAAERTERAWVQSMERINEAFVEAWKGGLDSFSDFADQFKNAFKQLFAELAHEQFTRPLVDSLSNVLREGLQRGTNGESRGNVGLDSLFDIFRGGGSTPGTNGNAGTPSAGANPLASFGQGLSTTLLSAAAFATAGRGGGAGGAAYLADIGVNTLAHLGVPGTSALASISHNASTVLGGASPSDVFKSGFDLNELGISMIATYAGGKVGNKAGEAIFDKEAESAIGQTIGATIGTFIGGPIGGFIGSTIGSLVDVAAGGDGRERYNVGTLVGHAERSDRVDGPLRVGASGLTFQTLSHKGGRKRGDLALDESNALTDTLFNLDTSLTEVARQAGMMVNLTGRRLGKDVNDGGAQGSGYFFGSVGFNTIDQRAYQDAPTEFVKAWLAEIKGQMPSLARSLIEVVDGTAEELANAFQASLNIADLIDLDVVKETGEALKALSIEQKSLGELYYESSNSVLDLADNLRGSAQSLVDLSNELTNQKRLAAQLAAEYRGISIEIDLALGSTIQSIREASMTNQELYTLRREQIADLTEQLQTASSPEVIRDLTAQVDRLTRESFGLLDDSQKESLRGGIIDTLTQVQGLAASRIDDEIARISATEQNVQEAIKVDVALQGQQEFMQAVQQFGQIVSQMTQGNNGAPQFDFADIDVGEVNV